MNAKRAYAFDGKANLARASFRGNECYFSIPTSAVRSAQKRKLVKAIDIKRILVETDNPVLGPDKEIRNEPMNVRVVLREVVSILKREEEMRKYSLTTESKDEVNIPRSGPIKGGMYT